MYESIKEFINISWDIKLWEYVTVSFFALMIGISIGTHK